MSYKHKQLEGHEILIGKHFKGANDENRATLRIEHAIAAILKDLCIYVGERIEAVNKPNFDEVMIKRCNEFGVCKDRVLRIIKGGK